MGSLSSRSWVWVGAVAAAVAVSVAMPAPAHAAAGDATARGVVVDLAATVEGIVVLSAEATIGTATAPATGGTDSSTLLAVDVPGAVGVSASGTVDEVTATREAATSSASATLSDIDLDVFGVQTLAATSVTASATCPAAGAQDAETTLAGVELFGAAVDVEANTPGVTADAVVVVPGMTGATLVVVLTRTETVTADGAAATAVLAELSLEGTVGGELTTIDIGTVILAEAICERPAAPTASSIDPDSGPESGGQAVTITGTGFVPDGTTVTFDGAAATDVVVAPDGNSLTAVTPAGEVGPASVVVSTVAGSAAPLDYTYLADGSGATVAGLDPTSGPTSGGTVVTITGSGFTGATGVRFGGDAGTEFEVNPAGTTIMVSTPPHPAGPVPVEIVFPAGTAGAGTFTFLAPTITSIDPDDGPISGGTRVTITGTGFGAASAVRFGGSAGSDLVASPDGTSVTVTTPPGAAGAVDVVVVLPGPDAQEEDGFTYLLAAPVIDAIDPDEGPTSGGTTVTVTGSGFVPGETAVTLCGVTRPAEVSADGASLTFVTPVCAAGAAELVVTTPAGTASGVTFRYLAGGLPATGDFVVPMVLLGLLLTGAGVLALLATRRRDAVRDLGRRLVP
jgi:hypothetical protein